MTTYPIIGAAEETDCGWLGPGIGPFNCADGEPPSPAFFDSFDRADGPMGDLEIPEGTPWVIGTSWTNPYVRGGAASVEGSGFSTGSAFVTPGVDWYYIEIVLANVAAQAEFWDIGLLAYSNLAMNAEIVFTFGTNSDPTVTLFSGGNTNVNLGHTWADGDVIRMTVAEDFATVYLNGVQIVQRATVITAPAGLYAGWNLGQAGAGSGGQLPGLIDSFTLDSLS